MTIAMTVVEASQIDSARRAVEQQAQLSGFDEEGANNAGFVAARLANFLAETSTRGQMLVTGLASGGVAGLELTALGDGGVDVDMLTAIAPFVASSCSYSGPARSSANMVRLWAQPPPVENHTSVYEIGAVSVPMPGEMVCGDGWWAEKTADRVLIALVDGLGHGPVAHHAAETAISIVHSNRDQAPRSLMALVHEGLRQTRGAAVLLVEVNFARQSLTCCGVGNIAGMIVAADRTRGLVSQHGIAGANKVRLQVFNYPFPSDALLILHSDGLKASWTIDSYGDLLRREPQLIAAVLYRDFVHGRDDTTVVVLSPRQGLQQWLRGDP